MESFFLEQCIRKIERFWVLSSKITLAFIFTFLISSQLNFSTEAPFFKFKAAPSLAIELVSNNVYEAALESDTSEWIIMDEKFFGNRMADSDHSPELTFVNFPSERLNLFGRSIDSLFNPKIEEVKPSKGNCATCIGVVDETLATCGIVPNCVSSFDDRPAYFIPPWEYEGSLEEAMNKLKKVIVLFDGVVIEEGERYIYATFMNDRRTDDVEFLFSKFDYDHTINIHSSSRSLNVPDGGKNAKRLENLRLQIGWDEVPILRNRKRLFGIIESPWDTFGPEPPPNLELNDYLLD